MLRPMPRVSDAYRQARRDQIAAAALRVLGRRGLRDLTMADIIEESGLSAGSVYSHFTRKEELVQLVATRVVGERLDLLKAPAEGPPRSPLEVVRWWMSALEDDGVPFGTVMQVWGEAAANGALRDIVHRRMSEVEEAFGTAAQAWLTATGRDPAGASAVARAMVTFCQGYIVRSALLGPQDLSASLAAVDLLASG